VGVTVILRLSKGIVSKTPFSSVRNYIFHYVLKERKSDVYKKCVF
jgi:hypothetical protein